MWFVEFSVKYLIEMNMPNLLFPWRFFFCISLWEAFLVLPVNSPISFVPFTKPEFLLVNFRSSRSKLFLSKVQIDVRSRLLVATHLVLWLSANKNINVEILLLSHYKTLNYLLCLISVPPQSTTNESSTAKQPTVSWRRIANRIIFPAISRGGIHSVLHRFSAKGMDTSRARAAPTFPFEALETFSPRGSPAPVTSIFLLLRNQ